MKKIKPFILYCMIAFFSWTSSNAQVSHCTNLGFELGNFSNWEGYTWIYSTRSPQNLRNTSPEFVNLPNPRRQEIMTDRSALDPNTGNMLVKISPGYKYSARLGDEYIHDSINHKRDTSRLWNQSLRYRMSVDSTNALLILKFALVLEEPTNNHAEIEEPRFKLTLFNQNGDTIPDCANYDVYASNTHVKGFQTYEPPRIEGQSPPTPIQWRDWTTVGVNLLKFKGQTITIEFRTADCTLGGHGGYAYFVAECRPLWITVKYCRGDSIASLKAPDGFEKYIWKDNTGVVVDSVQTLKLTDPKNGDTYSCSLTSPTGCTVELQTTISKAVFSTDFTSSMLDCKSNKVLMNNLSSTDVGKLLYNWDFGDGNFSSEENPQVTFATSGIHQVSLIVTKPPSTCADTLTKIVESFSPPLVGIAGNTTYCPGLSTWLKAYGAYDYTWSNNSKADSIEVMAPGGKYWMLGYSSTGCFSDTIFRSVREEPDWEFLDVSYPNMCLGEGQVLLKVIGAASYLWNTGETTNSIAVAIPGSYTATGTNTRGCKKSNTINVIEYPLPLVDFKTSPSVLDSRHNKIACQIAPQTGVSYSWDMGDGSTETGPTVQHTYNITNNMQAFTISLTAASIQGCTKSASVIIDIVPFIPNVFSPNGDGINEVFMPDLDIQIIDRYGLVLYKGTSGWDGTYNGRPMDPDTYFYLVHYTDRNQKEHTKKGYITLVR